MMRRALALAAALLPLLVQAGAQQYEPLAASVQANLAATIADRVAPEPQFPSIQEKVDWLTEMSGRLSRRMPDREGRLEFLKTVYYEAKRAGLDPQMVLGLIQVESGFKKYSVSSAGARGRGRRSRCPDSGAEWCSQNAGSSARERGCCPSCLSAQSRKALPACNRAHLPTNLRFGCTILRHYLDIENGDLYRALGRYNGSLGKPEYPNMVRGAWERQWAWRK